ncbi:Pectinesterase 2 [Apostasia shenzhenica]|uniref:Pectinesterase n=1 Tax=Apostasia shenzhenica TaxID=1088818 RepID=A0A2H9ZT69_9ASPA|nr:Pectinesterase 2 [Apostasia shenzhenica]
MNSGKVRCIFFLLSLFIVSTKSLPSIAAAGDVEWWCRLVPHPEPCRHYLSHPHAPHRLNRRSDFFKFSVEAALGLALRAQSSIMRLGSSYRSAPEKTAWLDCWKLLCNTVFQLNRTLTPPGGRRTNLDSQTWLSAALTNLHTCRRGFSELRANSTVILPVMRNRLSSLISNCLAINNAALNASAGGTTVPPVWSPAAGRKLLQLSARADFIVAQDGSGKFKTIKEALDAAAALRRSTGRRIVIYVKTGVYSEILNIVSSLSDITMTGDGKGKTIITGCRSVAGGYTTLSCPIFSVFSDGFMAIGMTFRNTFGPGSQAVALLSGSDRSVFYRCSFEGYQDTLCVYSQRQFYRECDISGTIDFIFGNAVAVIQSCNIFVRKPSKGEANVITAQGRTDQYQNTGIVIQFCRVTAAPEFLPVLRMVKSYLGRPWQRYSRAVFMQSFIDCIIDPAGWLPFDGDFALDTLYYAEYNNTGPGSGSRILRQRVKWRGFHLILRPSLIGQFTVGRFIAGGSWLPATGVPFTPGL